jgi:hypothetical protein
MKKALALGVVSLFTLAGIGRADIIPSFVSATPDGPNTLWTYTINVTVDQNALTNDYFTIYDFGSIVPGTNSQPTDWVFSASLLGVTPSQTIPPDSASILNLTWMYTGAKAIPSGGPIGPFQVETAGTFEGAPPTQNGYFAGRGTLVTGPDAGTKIGNVGQIPVPVPEASTTSLLVLAAALGEQRSPPAGVAAIASVTQHWKPFHKQGGPGEVVQRAVGIDCPRTTPGSRGLRLQATTNPPTALPLRRTSDRETGQRAHPAW